MVDMYGIIEQQINDKIDDKLKKEVRNNYPSFFISGIIWDQLDIFELREIGDE